MKKRTQSWAFVQRTGRHRPSKLDARRLRRMLAAATKVGIEVELNLKSLASQGCRGNKPTCSCISVFSHEKDGSDCYTRCSKKGNCDLEREVGCAGLDCIAFSSPCSFCPLFDPGCRVCPKKTPKNMSPRAIRERVSEVLEPTHFLGSLGKHGVLDVVDDGSLSNGGIEVVTVGRKVNFPAVQKMCELISKTCADEGAYVDERCSIHYHLLVGYLEAQNSYNSKRPNYGLKGVVLERKISDLEESVPEIVLANFHQLWRRYETAIVWMTSSGNKKSSITRWAKFRQKMSKYSAVRHSMYDIIQEIKRGGRAAGRYMMVNYNPTVFDSDKKNINRLHFEIRCADGNLSPSAIAAFASLFYAMLLKAVDLSVNGILERGDKDDAEQNRHVSNLLLNNDGDYSGPRTSDNRELDAYIPFLKERAGELVRLLRGGLADQGDAYEILKRLADSPCSMRRIAGHSWGKIERDITYRGKTAAGSSLDTVIDTVSITECETLKEWVEAVAEEGATDKSVVKTHVNTMMENGLAFWDASLGAVIRR